MNAPLTENLTCREGLAEGQASCSSKGDTSADSTTTASTPISSSTTASETPFIPPDDVVLALDCPSLTMDTTSIQLGSRRNDFRFECGVDLTSTSNINIVAVMAYSLDHCLRACVAYNDYASGDGCVAITFLADLSSLNQHRGNCYLKSERGEKKQFDASQRNVTISAVLKDD